MRHSGAAHAAPPKCSSLRLPKKELSTGWSAFLTGESKYPTGGSWGAGRARVVSLMIPNFRDLIPEISRPLLGRVMQMTASTDRQAGDPSPGPRIKCGAGSAGHPLPQRARGIFRRMARPRSGPLWVRRSSHFQTGAVPEQGVSRPWQRTCVILGALFQEGRHVGIRMGRALVPVAARPAVAGRPGRVGRCWCAACRPPGSSVCASA